MAALASLEGFQLDRVLSEDSATKTVAVLGRFAGKPGQAVVRLSRRHFQFDALDALLTAQTATVQLFVNDVYSKYTGTVPAEHGQITIDIIYPATEKHIAKNSTQHYFMVSETPEQYKEVTLPYIQSIPESRIQWVYNILNKSAEAERLIFEDADAEVGFMLHPDLKWDQKQMEGLYCVAICHRRDVHSLRDLDQRHLPLLTNIRDKGTQVILEKYGVGADQLRIYVHYQPSYYHFHVHFCHNALVSGGVAVAKAHLLSDIIDNIKMLPDYYARRTLSFTLGETDPLLAAFRG
ncbi:hypothetical protein WJX72_011745 [[Myrmecia] bisecta]|uniref:m7GpppX diphosphatase n=1 Tax=[Myrmecia] bisecta TaxID=41462 RepID=A0AAW1QTX7_9CHLO